MCEWVALLSGDLYYNFGILGVLQAAPLLHTADHLLPIRLIRNTKSASTTCLALGPCMMMEQRQRANTFFLCRAAANQMAKTTS